MMPSPFKEFKDFDFKEIHKKFGRILVQEPTESDYAEGRFTTQVWFIDERMNMYLLIEKVMK